MLLSCFIFNFVILFYCCEIKNEKKYCLLGVVGYFCANTFLCVDSRTSF